MTPGSAAADAIGLRLSGEIGVTPVSPDHREAWLDRLGTLETMPVLIGRPCWRVV